MQVVITEKQRRDSELEHKRILEECSRVMEEYRITERKLRSHIIKSRSIGAGEGRLHNNSAEMSQLCAPVAGECTVWSDSLASC